MKRRLLPVVLSVGLVALAACASSDPYVRTRGAQTMTPITEAPPRTVPFEESTVPAPSTTRPTAQSTLPDKGGPVFSLPADKKPQPYDSYLEAVVNDIQNFWRNEMPAVYGKPYEEIQRGIHPMVPGDVITPGCGQPQSDYASVEENAFYCSDGDFVAYDDAKLLPELVGQLTNVSIGVVFAHEWGHAIQARVGYQDETIYMEQQADCFSGAWTAHIARGENTEIDFTDADLKNALAAMIFVRDTPGTTQTDPLAHGSAFDRVGAFEDGFRNGVEKCSKYPDDKPKVIQFNYGAGDVASQENAPLTDPGDHSDIFSLVVKELNTYWPSVVTNMPTLQIAFYTGAASSACSPAPNSIYDAAFYCPTTKTVEVQQDSIGQIYKDPSFGDFGVAYVVATAWAEAALDTVGATVSGEQRALAADCMVGAFTRFDLPTEFNANRSPDDVTLSPGDLDEAVSAAIAAGDDSSDTNHHGSPFEKIEAFRLGVLSDLPACQQRFKLG